MGHQALTVRAWCCALLDISTLAQVDAIFRQHWYVKSHRGGTALGWCSWDAVQSHFSLNFYFYTLSNYDSYFYCTCHGTRSCHENNKVGICHRTIPTFFNTSFPLGERGGINVSPGTSMSGRTPHRGRSLPDQPSYGCAGPILTKIQFGSSDHLKTPREEWADMVSRRTLGYCALRNQASSHTGWSVPTEWFPVHTPYHIHSPKNWGGVLSFLFHPSSIISLITISI